MGGSLQELIINGNPIIWGCSPDASGMEDYKEFCNSGWLFPFPNRIEGGSYTFNGKSYQLELNDTKYGHAIHGFVYDKSFNLLHFSDHDARLNYRFTGTIGFPFEFDFEVYYRLASDAVHVTITAFNTGDSPFPMGIGWHPYLCYSSAEEGMIKMNSVYTYPLSESMIPMESTEHQVDQFPVEQGALDDVFVVRDQVVNFSSRTYDIKMRFNLGHFVQLFTPVGHNAVAIEPMSCIGNAFNNGVGLRTLDPGENAEWNIDIKLL